MFQVVVKISTFVGKTVQNDRKKPNLLAFFTVLVVAHTAQAQEADSFGRYDYDRSISGGFMGSGRYVYCVGELRARNLKSIVE